MTFFITYIINLMEYIFIYFIGNAYAGKKIKNNWLAACSIFPIVAFSCFLQIIITDPILSTFLCNLCIIILFFIIYKFRAIETILLYTITNITFSTFQLFLVMIFNAFNISIDTPIMGIIGNGMTILFSVLLYMFVPLNKLYNLVMSLNRFIKSALADLFVILFTIELLIKSNLGSVTDIVTLFLLVSFLLCINLDSIYYQWRFENQKKELACYEQYMPIVEELIDYIRIRQHDFDNNLQAMQMLPVSYTDYNSLSTALMSYKNHMDFDHSGLELLKLNLKLVSGFLISKISEAKLVNKHINIHIENYSLQSVIPEYTLIDIFGILIDNAIEAIPENENIDITLGSRENKIQFIIKNNGIKLSQELRNQFFQKGYSTKQTRTTKRGMGLYKLKKIIDSYDGMIILDNDKVDDHYVISFEVIL